MKVCPNCNMELPDEAHFCPRCMFQYEKQEIQEIQIKKYEGGYDIFYTSSKR